MWKILKTDLAINIYAEMHLTFDLLLSTGERDNYWKLNKIEDGGGGGREKQGVTSIPYIKIVGQNRKYLGILSDKTER